LSFQVPRISAHGWEILETKPTADHAHVQDHVNVHVDVHVLADVVVIGFFAWPGLDYSCRALGPRAACDERRGRGFQIFW
jgi:hypothetical protein